MWIANYSQKEADRLGLHLRFHALAPDIVPETDFGELAVEGYSRYPGMSQDEIVRGIASPLTQADVSKAVIEQVANPRQTKSGMFSLTGKGLKVASLCKW